ncbi:MAG: hypothetical protein JSW21_02030 [Gammaproteobacteria bacterium]|nr:MAG: hypothetical protein JSW21_02030 [Gammaproteobacteria bacterium]
MKKRHRITLLTPLIAALAAAMLYVPQASAVAYCALRDPVAAIQQLFPGRTTYKTFVGTVGRNIRPTLATELPFDFHFDEFGRHSLYAIFRDGRPEGFVQARSELGQWGLVEIVWALDLDLKILDFVFQRNRNPASRYIENSDFKDLLRGRGVDELAVLLTQLESGTLAEPDIPQKAMPLARIVIESAMKVIVVAGVVWEQDIMDVRALAAATREFSDADHVSIRPDPYDEARFGRLGASQLPEDSVFDRSTVRSFAVLDSGGDFLGSVLSTEFDTPTSHESLWWVVTNDGRVKSVNAQGGWSNLEARASIGSLDRTIEELSTCATPGELALLEVMLVARMTRP